MTVVTVRPDATVSSTGGTVTGAASRHAATSDDSDSSYVTFTTGDEFTLGFAEPSIPAGAVLSKFTARVRVAKVAATSTITVLPSGLPWTAADINWTTPTTIALIPTTASDADLSPLAASTQITYGAAGESVRCYELFADFTYVAKPTLNVTAPTGTVTDTNTPTVTWTETLDSDGGAQTKYEVKVFSAAQYGAGGFDPSTSTATYNSGTLSGSSLSHAVTTALADATYRAYVRVGQTVKGSTHWSDWDYEGFVSDATYPDTPSITLTAQASDGRIKVDLDDAATGATTDMFEVQVSRDGGTTWEAMRLLSDDDGRVAPASGLATVYDYEAANGVATYYRARALHNYSGIYAASAWASANATWSSSDWWIKHPNQPSLNLAVVPGSLPTINRSPRQGVFTVLGRELPVIVDDVRGGAVGTITLNVETTAERTALDALLDAGDTLLLQGRSADYWTDRYVRFGEQTSARMVDKAYVEATYETLPWTEVEAPAGVVDAWPS